METPAASGVVLSRPTHPLKHRNLTSEQQRDAWPTAVHITRFTSLIASWVLTTKLLCPEFLCEKSSKHKQKRSPAHHKIFRGGTRFWTWVQKETILRENTDSFLVTANTACVTIFAFLFQFVFGACVCHFFVSHSDNSREWNLQHSAMEPSVRTECSWALVYQTGVSQSHLVKLILCFLEITSTICCCQPKVFYLISQKDGSQCWNPELWCSLLGPTSCAWTSFTHTQSGVVYLGW